MSHQAVVLIVGVLIFALASLLAFWVRKGRFVDTAPEPLKRLLPTIPNDLPPTGTKPAMVKPLHGHPLATKDLLVTIVDLSTRGFIRIKPLIQDGKHYDWALSATGKTSQDLADFEQTLLSAFNPEHPPITVSRLLIDPTQPVQTARRQLIAELEANNWIESERGHHNPWGICGASILLIGIVLTVAMIIDWLASANLLGVIGAIMLAAAGGVLASLGRGWHPPESVEEICSQLDTYAEQLSKYDPAKLKMSLAPKQFSKDLPWAIQLGVGKDFGAGYDKLYRQAGSWGQPSEMTLDWLDTDNPYSPSEVVEMVNALVSTS